MVVGVRKAEYYYTGGLLRNQQVPMPIDIDLTATEAVMRSGGPLVNGGFGGGNFQGTIITNEVSSTNPSLLTVLRKGPNNRRIPIRVDLNEALRDPREDILIQDGDTLLLQQTTGEAFARYFMDHLNITGSYTNSTVCLPAGVYTDLKLMLVFSMGTASPSTRAFQCLLYPSPK